MGIISLENRDSLLFGNITIGQHNILMRSQYLTKRGKEQQSWEKAKCIISKCINQKSRRKRGKKRSSISGWRLSLNNGGYFRYTKVIYHDTKDIENLIQCEFYGALHMAYRNWLYYSWPLVNMYTSCMPQTIMSAKQVLTTTTRNGIFFLFLVF